MERIRRTIAEDCISLNLQKQQYLRSWFLSKTYWRAGKQKNSFQNRSNWSISSNWKCNKVISAKSYRPTFASCFFILLNCLESIHIFLQKDSFNELLSGYTSPSLFSFSSLSSLDSESVCQGVSLPRADFVSQGKQTASSHIISLKIIFCFTVLWLNCYQYKSFTFLGTVLSIPSLFSQRNPHAFHGFHKEGNIYLQINTFSL